MSGASVTPDGNKRSENSILYHGAIDMSGDENPVRLLVEMKKIGMWRVIAHHAIHKIRRSQVLVAS